MAKDNPFEMPANMAAFVEKSMQQARSAFDAWTAATQQAVNAAQGQALGGQTGAREMADLAVRYAETNIAASFQFAQKLLQAKDAKELAALHSEYVQSQMQVLGEQAKELGQRAAKLGRPDASN